MQITLAEGLVQLKRTGERIQKKIMALDTVAGTVGGKMAEMTISETDFRKNAKADYQSIRALIKRRGAIKGAIVLANATNFVNVGGVKMSIAEAIERKQSIAFDKALLMKLREDHAGIISWHKAEREIFDRKVSDTTARVYGSTEKVDPADGGVAAIIDTLKAQYSPAIVDPLEIDKVIRELTEEIDQFEQEIDIALTEANVRTTIEIPDETD